MADPNFAAVAEMVAFAANHFDEIEKYSVTATTGFIATQELFRNDLEGSWAQSVREAMEAQRARAATLVSSAAVRAHVDPLLEQLMDAIDKPIVDVARNWEQLYDYMVANSQSLNSRGLTYGSPSASGTGTGTCVRVTLDEEGESLEGWWPDAFTLTCTHDANRLGGTIGNEQWELTGTAAAPDNLERDGTSLIQRSIATLCDRDSTRIVTNPSFDDGSFSGSTITTLNGWTATSSIANFETNTTSTYIWLDTTRGSGATARSLRIIANDTISQVLSNNARPSLSRDVPYTICVAVYRRDTCDGTLTFTFGAVSRAVTVSSLSDNAWTLVHLVSTPGANNWYENLKANTFTVSFQLAGHTTGSVYLDGLVVAPMTRIGQHPRDRRAGRGATGTYLSVIAGRTPFLMGDTFTFTDSEGTRGVNQFWLGQIAGYGYLPSDAAAGETIADK